MNFIQTAYEVQLAYKLYEDPYIEDHAKDSEFRRIRNEIEKLRTLICDDSSDISVFLADSYAFVTDLLFSPENAELAYSLVCDDMADCGIKERDINYDSDTAKNDMQWRQT